MRMNALKEFEANIKEGAALNADWLSDDP